MTIFLLIITLLLILVFSSLIVAYNYSNKIYLNLESKKESVSSYTLKVLAENPRLYITSLKFGNTLCLAIFCYYLYMFFEEYYEYTAYQYGYGVYLSVFLIAGILLVYLFSKFLPQTFVKPFATQIITNCDLLIRILLKLLSPFTKPLLLFADFILKKFFNLHPSKDIQLLSIGDLGSYITKQMEASEEQENLDTELQILKNALAFTDVKVKEIMTPRVEIEAVEINSPLQVVKERFISTGYSKLLVYDTNSDNIVGYIHIFGMLQNPDSIKNILYPIEIVADSTYIKELFQNLSVNRKSTAIVVDEYGGLTGMVTIEDIIEELFGEIDDEHDDLVEWVEKQVKENKYIFSARLEVSYLNEKYKLNLEESNDYNTLAGYIISNRHTIPQKNEIIHIENNQFKVLASSDKRLEIIEVTLG